MKNRLYKMTLLILAAGCPSAPSQAASLRISGTIPVACEASIVSSDISGRRLTISIHRSCNTWHSLSLRADSASGLGEIDFRYNGDQLFSRGSDAWFDPPERFYDGTDQVTIEASAGDEADLSRYAQSLRLELETH
jgi:hypothetical protein